MKNKEETALIETVMDKAFTMMYSNTVIHELIAPDVTDYERGRLAGKIEMMTWMATEFNGGNEVKEVEDEDALAGQKLD